MLPKIIGIIYYFTKHRNTCHTISRAGLEEPEHVSSVSSVEFSQWGEWYVYICVYLAYNRHDLLIISTTCNHLAFDHKQIPADII